MVSFTKSHDTCILPAASPHSAKGRRDRGQQRENISSSFSVMPMRCVYLLLGAGAEKVIHFYARDRGQKSYSLETNSKPINCNSQRFHPQHVNMRPSHRTSEMFRDRRTLRPTPCALQDRFSPSCQNYCA